jgi:hypothetical protein
VQRRDAVSNPVPVSGQPDPRVLGSFLDPPRQCLPKLAPPHPPPPTPRPNPAFDTRDPACSPPSALRQRATRPAPHQPPRPRSAGPPPRSAPGCGRSPHPRSNSRPRAAPRYRRAPPLARRSPPRPPHNLASSPGSGETIARSRPRSALNRELFPAFGGPASTTLARSRERWPAAKRPSQASKPADNRANSSSQRRNSPGLTSSGKSSPASTSQRSAWISPTRRSTSRPSSPLDQPPCLLDRSIRLRSDQRCDPLQLLQPKPAHMLEGPPAETPLPPPPHAPSAQDCPPRTLRTFRPPACTCSSTTSSPVNERGPGIHTTSASSTPSSELQPTPRQHPRDWQTPTQLRSDRAGPQSTTQANDRPHPHRVCRSRRRRSSASTLLATLRPGRRRSRSGGRRHHAPGTPRHVESDPRPPTRCADRPSP